MIDFHMYIAIILLILLLVSLYYCIKFALIIVKIQESIEVSLDIIDIKYLSISKILETPVFTDSPEVKLVLKEIDDTRNSLLYIANELTNNNIEDDSKPYDRPQ